MRIESGKQVEHFGAVRLHPVRRVLELDSGVRIPSPIKDSVEPQRIDRDVIAGIQRELAIVLPIKDEDVKVFEGVLSGIPHDCLMIVMSNSRRGEIDNLKKEREILDRFCIATKRNALIVHQKDPRLGEALADCGYSQILDEKGLVRSGKAEGMLIGILLAMALGKEYVGFIDTDNYIPGAVWEYAQHYAVGFSLSDSPYVMTRLLWRYKPKMSGELYFRKWGRVSEITNKYVNHFISAKGRFETDIIKTANAGEHAMSLQLAKKLTYATGYGVETQELMSIFEQFSGLASPVDKAVMEKGVDIIQTETINPHVHEERGEEHLLKDILMPSLSVIYHNPLCEDGTRRLITRHLIELECIPRDGEVPSLLMLPPPETVDAVKFGRLMDRTLSDYAIPKGWPVGVSLPPAARKTREAAKLVFTDLDGTLLHPVSYSYAAALDSVRKLQEAGIPIVFCSAKTMAEQQVYRHELGIADPFIIENGAAIVVPKDYFRFPFSFSRIVDDYFVIELGAPYQEVRSKLRKLCGKQEAKVTCFGDLTTEEVSKVTGLNLLMAALAKQREYSETVIIEGDKKQLQSTLAAIEEVGLSYTFGGRFYEACLGGDKGKAVKILLELFKLNFGDAYTVGIGDSLNDAEMLTAVDSPMIVQTGDKRWNKLNVKNLKRVSGIGPEGWARAASEVLGGSSHKK
ncbi:MAG: bifunctional mannosyl-3-phosphoglycerate synthase/mannosyl-3 phosphoglycerate phosphatase [Dehalococcoidia bacterium]|nr:MAG: bifunctional mannosyl-3-phosphoglycerate synthase/mannosyl-3 phosphoglycerate phosphatase [Dehalococcoidia bacterium]